MDVRQRTVVVSTLLVAFFVEAITLALRFGRGLTAVEFKQTAPLWLQVHHMFWAVPLFAVVLLVRKRRQLSGALLGCGLGLVLSDLAHHFVILPMTVGNTGWHWP